MKSTVDPIASLGVSTQDIAWVVVLAVCIFMMVAPFAFWAIVMVTRRKEQPIAAQAGAQIPRRERESLAPDELAS
jgi:hypothetical protein